MNEEITEIKALSWKEPYGTLMLHGKAETRNWNTSYRGWVLLCASKTAYNWAEVLEISGEMHAERIIDVLSNRPPDARFRIAGSAFAIGKLVECRRMRYVDADQCFVRYNQPLYYHKYEQVQEIEPFPWKGQLGFKALTQEQINFVLSRLKSNDHA